MLSDGCRSVGVWSSPSWSGGGWGLELSKAKLQAKIGRVKAPCSPSSDFAKSLPSVIASSRPQKGPSAPVVLVEVEDPVGVVLVDVEEPVGGRGGGGGVGGGGRGEGRWSKMVF